MPKTTPRIPEFYRNAVEIDTKTGAPADYFSCFVGYRNATMAAADKMRLPHADREDAAQEVQLRFWLRDSLAKYDPERIFQTAAGNKRTARFGSMYGSFVGLSMLAERDKYINYISRVNLKPTEDMPDTQTEDDPAEEISGKDAAQRWASTAERALREADRSDLIPVLHLCQQAAVLASTVTRADIVAATGCKLRYASDLLKDLREQLKLAGLGPESLTDGN